MYVRTQKEAIEILEQAYAACSIVFGSKLSDAYLYGSYAREEQHEHSDVDIMILVDVDDEELAGFRNKVAVIASNLSLEQDITVSIMVKSAAQFNRYVEVVPFYANIINEGIKYADIIDNERFYYNRS